VSCKASGLLHGETARAKPGNVQSFCCDACSLPAAHTNKTFINTALIMH